MPSAAVEAAFRSRLEANWNVADGVILGSNGVTRAPANGAPFLVIHYPVATNTRPALSRKRFEEGAARIIFNAETGDGLPGPLALADAIAAAFRGDKLIVSGVEMFEPSPPIVNDDSEDGNYFELSIIVPYRYQFNAPSGDSP